MQISHVATSSLKTNLRNARTHSRAQINEIAKSVTAFGFLVPILIDDNGIVLAGQGRHSRGQPHELSKRIQGTPPSASPWIQEQGIFVVNSD